MVPFIRKAHRWMAPLFVVALIAVIITGPPRPDTPAQIIQQVLMLLLMLSGIVLFVYPFWARSRKRRTQQDGEQA
jgi:hypothetical protein